VDAYPVKLGSRIPRTPERRRTVIDSMVNGTAGGHFKTGMPIVEPRRVPLVAAASEPVAPWAPDFNGYGGETTSPGFLTCPAGAVGDSVWCAVLTYDTATVTVDDFTFRADQSADGFKVSVFTKVLDGSESMITVNVSGPDEHAAAAGYVPAVFDSIITEDWSAVASPYDFVETEEGAGLFGVVFLAGVNGATIPTPPSMAGVLSVSLFEATGTSIVARMTYYAHTVSGTYTFEKGSPPSELSGFIRTACRT
jgi:hypothetical protein